MRSLLPLCAFLLVLLCLASLMDVTEGRFRAPEAAATAAAAAARVA
ncbi:hypothetical protein ZWY2020_030307 [Hordeum vulgare]|nr:hypothetical protein ZWY2020_030307 [Hordeum vulgare]